ncbi:hypothetical protein [Chryseobacterium sp. Mn2064]|uniref:hypothetical protein n=1 Tax=Chryseobacterium sp. Mn2064 TaxID=3395263 RepID=UPI003BD46625
MDNYIVYIELHDANVNDYENLKKHMLEDGHFSDKIVDINGTAHKISSNFVYYASGKNLEHKKVFDNARNAVLKTNAKNSIVVARTEFISLFNLIKD